MQLREIIELIISILTLGSFVFAIFLFFKKPQDKLEKDQAVNNERDKNKATLTSFEVLKSNFDIMCGVNNQKFEKLEKQIIDAFAIANNHINTTDTKVDSLVKEVGCLRNDVTELKTIINERIPKKE